MSECTGFRITVFFNLFFTDQKSRSSVYVNTNRCKTVQALKDHISTLFDLPHGDYDLHCANNFLPPEEDIRVLSPDDTVLIVPNRRESKRKRKRSVEIVKEHVLTKDSEENSLDLVRNSKLKRKRSANIEQTEECLKNITSSSNKTKKKLKELIDLTKSTDEQEKTKDKAVKVVKFQGSEEKSPETTESNEQTLSTIEKITFFEHLTHSSDSNPDKVKDSMRRCSLAKCNSYNNNNEHIQSAIEHVEGSPLKETPTFITNRKKGKRSSTPFYRPIATLLQELKTTSTRNIVEENEENGDGANNSTTKKRKRYRKRKRQSVNVEESADESQPNLQSYSNLPSTSNLIQSIPAVQRTHIKFSENIEIIPDNIPQVPYSPSEGIDQFATATDNGENSTDSAIEVTSNGGSRDAIEIVETNLTMASILSSPSMKNIIPKAGDLIAFKMLRLTESYTPEVSQYITAKTIYYDIMSSSISLQIIEGADQMKLPNGKFSLELLEGIEEKGGLSDEMTISWNQLIDPRLLYP